MFHTWLRYLYYKLSNNCCKLYQLPPALKITHHDWHSSRRGQIVEDNYLDFLLRYVCPINTRTKPLNCSDGGGQWRQFFCGTLFLLLSRMEIDKQMEQRFNINFFVKLGKNSEEIHEMLRTVYEANTLKKLVFFLVDQAFHWGPWRLQGWCKVETTVDLQYW